MWLTKSSIGRKVVMSVSGLFLVLFLTFHMCMNLALVFSPEAYNTICGLLGAHWYTLALTAVLAAGFIVHIVYAFWLTIQNRRARGNDRYAVNVRPKGVEWSSQNMLVLGIIVILFLVLHMAQFWFKMQFNEVASSIAGLDKDKYLFYNQPHNGASLVIAEFSHLWVVILYIVWLVALWFHLTHGFWSALHTIGFNNNIWFNRWKVIGNVFATVICLGFAFVLIALYLHTNIDGGILGWNAAEWIEMLNK